MPLNICFLEPLKLKVGHEYNLNNVKEIKVSDDFLTLDKTIRNCQNVESLQDCQTRKYIDASIEQCKCLPFTIRDFNQVLFQFLLFLRAPFILILGPLSNNRTTKLFKNFEC